MLRCTRNVLGVLLPIINMEPQSHILLGLAILFVHPFLRNIFWGPSCLLGYMFICGGDSESQLKSSPAHCLPPFPQWTVGRPGLVPPATAMAHCLFGPIGEMGSGLVIQLRGLAQEQLHLGHHWRRCFSPQKTLDGFIRMGCCTGVQASNRSSP